MFSSQFYEKWVSVRERNVKLLLESVTYIAITETVTCILQQKQLCTAESTTCINCRRDSHLHKQNKNWHSGNRASKLA